jgi:hypothetical protein
MTTSDLDDALEAASVKLTDGLSTVAAIAQRIHDAGYETRHDLYNWAYSCPLAWWFSQELAPLLEGRQVAVGLIQVRVWEASEQIAFHNLNALEYELRQSVDGDRQPLLYSSTTRRPSDPGDTERMPLSRNYDDV